MAAPGVWPRERVRPCTSEAEVRVWEALKAGLPGGWYAWHSLRIKSDEGELGEGDFVIADPKRGLVVLEVKGGRLEQRDGRWLQNGKELDRAPLDQARTFAKKLTLRLAEAGLKPEPPYGAAACFPDVPFDAGPLQDDLRGAILGARELGWLGDALPALFRNVIPAHREVRGPFVDALHRLWGETWTPQVSLGTRVRDEGERWLQLDPLQAAVLEGIAEHPRVLVTGGAGSGKTVVAMEAARRHAAAGRRTLVVCFTRSLATWLRERLEPEGLTVRTTSELAQDLLREAGQPVLREPEGTDGWDELYLRAVDAAPAIGWDARFDAVVLDEAQDLTEASWLLLEAMGGSRILWAFLDERQRFWPDRAPPKLDWVRFALPGKHRCAPGILAVAAAHHGDGDEAAVRAAFAEGAVKLLPCPTRASIPERIGREIDRLLSEKLTPGDIAVISVRGQTARDAIFTHEKLGRHRIVPADSPEMKDHVVADSFLRMKGLERPAVIVTDLGLLAGDDEHRAVRMYVALTRARLAARIAGTPDDLRSDPVLAPFVG